MAQQVQARVLKPQPEHEVANGDSRNRAHTIAAMEPEVHNKPCRNRAHSEGTVSNCDNILDSLNEDNAVDLVGEESEQTLWRLFQHATISEEDVMKLGLSLGVGWDITEEIIRSENSTQMAVVHTCRKWIEKLGHKNKVTAAKQLYEALQSINHGRIARQLINNCRNRTLTLSDLNERIIWHQLDVAVETFVQAEIFGKELELEQGTIDECIRQKTASLAAHKMFVEKKKNTKREDDVKLLNTLKNALTTIAKESHPKDDIHVPEPDETTPLYPKHVKTGILRQYLTSCVAFALKKKVVVATTCLIFLLYLATIVFSLLMLSLGYNINTDTLPILPPDTILIPLPSRAPPYIDLQLVGPNDSCKASAIAVRCDDIVTYNITSAHHNISHDYIYLAESSQIVIEPSNVDLSNIYDVWLFDSIVLANQAVMNRFEGMNCIPKNLCEKIYEDSGPSIFNIPKSSYYFLRCGNIKSFKCKGIKYVSYEAIAYNFKESAESSSSEITLEVQDDYERLKLRNEHFPSPSSVSMCALVTLSTAQCGNTSESKYFVSVHYVPPYSEMLVYILTCAVAPAIIVLLSINIGIRCYMRRNRVSYQASDYNQLDEIHIV